uniref:Uncharacterized protein n=1 Tax=Schistocephalus solidus TaxID=70667 RepID=A0A0X3PLD0_SCHSO
MSQNLNKIEHDTPFGHTDYVPTDETRNFSALFPSIDVLTERLKTKGTVNIVADLDLYTPEQVREFDEKIATNPLPCDNYRKLAWDGQHSPTPSAELTHPTAGTATKRGAKHSIMAEPLTATETFSELPELEAYYRGSASTPFRIDPMACHLIDQSAALAQDRRLKCRLGNSVILLNDPVYAQWLRGIVQKEMNEEEDKLCAERVEEEIVRDAKAKKKGRFVVDELFNAMRLPELCDQKPWLPQSKKTEKLPRLSSASRSTDKSSVVQYARAPRTQEAGRTSLPPIEKPPEKPTEAPEAKPKEELKLPSISRDRLSEAENISAMFDQADNILQNPEEYSKLTVSARPAL